MIVYSPDWGPKMPPAAGPEEGLFQTFPSCVCSVFYFSSTLAGAFPKPRNLPQIVGALLGMPARVEGSAMTLIPNSSTTDVADERKFFFSPTLLKSIKLIPMKNSTL